MKGNKIPMMFITVHLMCTMSKKDLLTKDMVDGIT